VQEASQEETQTNGFSPEQEDIDSEVFDFGKAKMDFFK